MKRRSMTGACRCSKLQECQYLIYALVVAPLGHGRRKAVSIKRDDHSIGRMKQVRATGVEDVSRCAREGRAHFVQQHDDSCVVLHAFLRRLMILLAPLETWDGKNCRNGRYDDYIIGHTKQRVGDVRHPKCNAWRCSTRAHRPMILVL